MKALILSQDLIVLNVVDVADEKHLELIAVGGLPKMLQTDIAPEEADIFIGDDVSGLVMKARELATDETKDTVLKRIMRALGITL